MPGQPPPHLGVNTDETSRWLLAFARGSNPSADTAPTASVLELAVRHGLMGLMAESPHEHVRNSAIPVYTRLLARQTVMERHLQRILVSLNDSDIPATVLKGPHLARGIYSNPHHRTFTDIDILVPAEQVASALEVLAEDPGVVSIPPKTPKADKRNIPMVDPSGISFNLDLHWDLFSYSQLRGCAEGATGWAWEHARFVPDHQLGPLWDLPEETMIAFLGTHAVLDHRFRLILFRDLAEVARHDPDWDAVIAFARRWGLRSTTYVAFLLARQIADAPIDDQYLEELRPRSIPIRAVDFLLRRVDIVHFDGHQIHPLNLAMVMLHDERSERLRLLAQAPLAFPAWRRRVGADIRILPTGVRREQLASGSTEDARPLTLHVLPVDLARGAQTYAEALSRTLNGELGEHRTMTIFESKPIALNADIELGAVPGLGRQLGFDPLAAWRLFRTLRQLRPDVVVAHGGESLKYASLTSSRRTSLVYYKIGTSRIHLSNWIRRLIYRVVSLRCDLVAGVSREMVTEATAVLGVPQDRAVYAPNGRDPARFVPWKGSDGDTTRFVNVGNLNENKRPRLFVEVIRQLHNSGRAVEGVLVGDGPLLDEISALARGLPIDVLGRRDDVPAILARSDIFLFTSVAEGMPGVLIEAAMAGLPIITTDVSGAREIVDHEKTGLVVAKDDLKGLIDAAIRLQSDPQLRESMGEAGRAKSLDEFTLEASIEEWRGVFRELANEREPARRW